MLDSITHEGFVHDETRGHPFRGDAGPIVECNCEGIGEFLGALD